MQKISRQLAAWGDCTFCYHCRVLNWFRKQRSETRFSVIGNKRRHRFQGQFQTSTFPDDVIDFITLRFKKRFSKCLQYDNLLMHFKVATSKYILHNHESFIYSNSLALHSNNIFQNYRHGRGACSGDRENKKKCWQVLCWWKRPSFRMFRILFILLLENSLLFIFSPYTKNSGAKSLSFPQSWSTKNEYWKCYSNFRLTFKLMVFLKAATFALYSASFIHVAKNFIV